MSYVGLNVQINFIKIYKMEDINLCTLHVINAILIDCKRVDHLNFNLTLTNAFTIVTNTVECDYYNTFGQLLT